MNDFEERLKSEIKNLEVQEREALATYHAAGGAIMLAKNLLEELQTSTQK